MFFEGMLHQMKGVLFLLSSVISWEWDEINKITIGLTQLRQDPDLAAITVFLSITDIHNHILLSLSHLTMKN